MDELVVIYRSTTQFIKETKQPNTGRVPNHNRADFDYMTFLLPDHKQADLTSHMISQGSTVTVVLLTFEALVVALVPVVVATYPLRHLDHRENKDGEKWHLCSACLGEFLIRQARDSCLRMSIRICQKRGTTVVRLSPSSCVDK